MPKNNSPKFAFFYLLSLVALVFMSISVGIVIFQIINKEIVDIVNIYSGRYSDEAIKFAISSLFVSTPIFYITSRQIYKNLFKGELNEEAGVRKWLTYFILLVAIVVMIGWLIATINGFLGGELTTKFILKALTALIISGAIFSFYLYDIRREGVVGKKDKTISLYAWSSLVLVVIIFIVAFMVVESPQETRKRRLDEQVVRNFHQIDNAINSYYKDTKEIPSSLDILQDKYSYLSDSYLENPATRERYEYNVISDKEYELCAVFNLSNKDEGQSDKYYYGGTEWYHGAGHECLSRKINVLIGEEPVLLR